MINVLDGRSYLAMLENGVLNINQNKQMLNDLNVFPVPDGDTGTNMYMTLKYAIENCKKGGTNITDVANEISSLAVFGARGNSGVILSQFLKGVSDGFLGAKQVDAKGLCVAFEKGCEYAYASVAKPVEGTMLTVIKESTIKVKKSLPLEDVKEVLQIFLSQAQQTLEKTPDLLPVLKKAGVVDSGGSGIVILFEGFYKYFTGEKIEQKQAEDQESFEYKSFDLSKINKDSPMDYGYCIEGLLQLKIDQKDFRIDRFKKVLDELGDSVVASIEKDKVKLHVHSKRLGKIMDYCQRFGEFLTIKIENMSVQNLAKLYEDSKRILVAKEFGENFNIVAVATNVYMQKKFLEMGVDVVITSDITPSSQDFIDAFSYLDKEILVFPNSANSILSAVQASGLCSGKKINVINSRSVADCYSALSVLDFDYSAEEAIDSINEVISELNKVFVYRAPKERNFNGAKIEKDDYFSLVNNEKIIYVDDSIEKVILKTVKKVVKENDSQIVTLFYASGINEQFIEKISEQILELDLNVDVANVCTMEKAYSLILVFE